MTITWGFGLPRIQVPGGEAHQRLLVALWQLSPKDAGRGDCIRDVQRVGGTRVVFEVDHGTFQRTAEPLASAIVAELEDDAFASWRNDVAAAFHDVVGPLGVPWYITDLVRGWVDVKQVELPVLGRLTIQHISRQCHALLLDDGSEILDDYGLTADDARAINGRSHALAALARDRQLAMWYG